MKRVPLLVIITPRACARGKVISSVVIVVVGVVVIVISTKIAKSQKKQALDRVLNASKRSKVTKSCFICFKSPRKAHEHYKSCIFTSHTY